MFNSSVNEENGPVGALVKVSYNLLTCLLCMSSSY